MAVEVFMPKAGMDMKEGKIVQWLKNVGDSVEEGEGVLEIETDKVTMEVESPATGTLLCQYFADGDTVPVVTTIAYIGDAGEAVPDAPKMAGGEETTLSVPQAVAKAEATAPTKATAPTSAGYVKATPYAKMIAKKHNISLNAVAPSGTSGEVKARDVFSYIENEVPKITPLALAMANDLGVDIATIKGTGFDGKITKEDVLQAIESAETTGEKAVATTSAPTTGGNVRRVKMSGMRKVVAERMSQSHTEIPCVTHNMKSDVTDLMEVRARINEKREKADKISLNDFVLKAVAIALLRHPDVLTSIDGDDMLYHEDVNIGMAVAVPNGLLVPVLKHADKMSLGTLSKTAKDLAVRARDGKLEMDEYKGSTFTISNLGMYEVESFTPIVNQPNAGILGVCTVTDEVRVIDGNFVARKMMGLSFTHDHRVLDGAPAADFLREVKHLLQDPMGLLVD